MCILSRVIEALTPSSIDKSFGSQLGDLLTLFFMAKISSFIGLGVVF